MAACINHASSSYKFDALISALHAYVGYVFLWQLSLPPWPSVLLLSFCTFGGIPFLIHTNQSRAYTLNHLLYQALTLKAIFPCPKPARTRQLETTPGPRAHSNDEKQPILSLLTQLHFLPPETLLKLLPQFLHQGWHATSCWKLSNKLSFQWQLFSNLLALLYCKSSINTLYFKSVPGQ